MIVLGEDFKRRLKDYAEGKLSENERKEVESELQKMEDYQNFLEEQMKEEGSNKMNDSNCPRELSKDEQIKILKRGKWKARLQNALAAIGIILVATIIFNIFTAVFYDVGKISRREIYRDVVNSTIAVTQPNIRAGNSGSSTTPFMSMNLDSGLYKRVGSEDIRVGEMSVKFLLGQAGYPQRKWLMEKGVQDSSGMFCYPSSERMASDGEWIKLEKLPEGTVSEVYVSLDKFYGTGEILGKFKDKDINPLWFAVDTGFDKAEPGLSDQIVYPIGFPSNPIWHNDDWTLVSSKEEKTGIIGRTVSITKSAPEYDPYGSEKLRNENFIKTLNLMKKYEKIVDRITNIPGLNLEKRIEYINANGINIYGVVVTGPSKEILKLKDEAWVAGIKVGEVRLWNWE